MKIVVDTSVYVSYLRAKKGPYIELINLGAKATLYTPTIVVSELWSGTSMNNPAVAAEVRKAISPSKIIMLNRQLAENSGELVRSGVISNLQDAVVAATAIYLNAKLATLNTKDFVEVARLKLFE